MPSTYHTQSTYQRIARRTAENYKRYTPRTAAKLMASSADREEIESNYHMWADHYGVNVDALATELGKLGYQVN